MIKSLLTYSFVFVGVYFLIYGVHESYIESNFIKLSYNLQKVYLFHFGFSLLICVNFKLFSTVDKIFDQLGYIYLATLVLKLILFAIIFYQSIFNEENLSQMARISLLIPTIIFLSTEAIFVIRILNKKNT